MKNKDIHNSLGFTLVDLIISIGIFGVITAMVMVNYRAGNRNDTVRQSASISASVLRRAQTMTLTGALTAGVFPQGGYGVRFDEADNNTMILFADIDGNFAYTPVTDTDIETINLPGNAVFESNEDAGSTGSLDVVFSPPDADAYFDGLTSSNSKQISFSARSSDAATIVIVYRLSGQIRVQ
jgi:type II secretory pathway pseudopilin PulG